MLTDLYYMQRLDGISTDKRFVKKFIEDYKILKDHYKFPILITIMKRLFKISQYILK